MADMQHATICLADAPRPDSGAPLPDRLLLLKDGDNPAGDGAVYRVDERTYAALSAQIAAGVFDRLVIDFNHQSVKGHPNYKPDPRSHAGYGKLEAVPGEGVFLSAIEWTEEGKLHRADYPDLSPAILTAPDTDPDGAKSVRGLVSVAVCTNGMLADGPRCLSAEIPEEAGEEARQDGAPPKTPGTPPGGEGANGSEPPPETPPGGEGASTRSGGSASNGSATPATPPPEVREALAALAAEVKELKELLVTLTVDRNGREHVDAGSPEGGQFAPGEGALSKEARADYKKGFRTSHLNPRNITPATVNAALKDSRWAYSAGLGSAADKKAHKRAHFELQRDLHRKAIKAGLTYNAATHLYE